jgi:hypothetical protein
MIQQDSLKATVSIVKITFITVRLLQQDDIVIIQCDGTSPNHKLLSCMNQPSCFHRKEIQNFIPIHYHIRITPYLQQNPLQNIDLNALIKKARKKEAQRRGQHQEFTNHQHDLG